MNFNKIVLPFTQAVAKTTDSPLPTKPVWLDLKARRFLFDNIMSEMGEYLTSSLEVDKIDALCDGIIYATDTCLRFGIEPYAHPRPNYNPNDVVDSVFRKAKSFLKAQTIATQQQALSFLIGRMARGHAFDLTPFVAAVGECNKQKINADGTVTLNERGKVLKPDDFVDIDLSQILEAIKNGKSG